MNCDAIVGDKFSCIAVVVWDWRGKLIFAHSKKVYTKVSVQEKTISCIAVVVRDWRRKLVFAHSKKVYTKVFVQAKAKAILSKVVRPGLRTSVKMG